MSHVCCHHEHHTWRYTKDAWQVRLLCKPLIVVSERRLNWVERSRFVFGVRNQEGTQYNEYTLSLLGILHGLFGIVLWIED